MTVFRRKQLKEETKQENPKDSEGQKPEPLTDKEYMMLDAYMAFGREVANTVPQLHDEVKEICRKLYDKYYADKRDLPEAKVINLGEKGSAGMGAVDTFTGGRLIGPWKRPF